MLLLLCQIWNGARRFIFFRRNTRTNAHFLRYTMQIIVGSFYRLSIAEARHINT